MAIVRVKLEDAGPISKERLEEIAAIPDDQIDTSEIPELDADWFAQAEWRDFSQPKKQVTLRLDPDVIEFFKKDGRGYQTRINAALRAFMRARRKSGG